VKVKFRDLSDDEIEHYLRIEQPYDCAGSAKSEGLGIALLESIDNDDPTALVGLPLIRTCRMIQAAGVKLLSGGRHERRRQGQALPGAGAAGFRLRRAGAAAGRHAAADAAVASQLSCWICENAKSTRAYLKRIDALHPLSAPLQSQQIQELPREVHKKGDHSGNFDARPLLAAAMEGRDMGLVSEAGMPAIADPGSSVVRAAHDLGLEVVPLTGPMSLMLALAASGLNGQSFAFAGYVPQAPAERVQRIRELESLALKSGQTQLFIETPYRNAALFQSLLQTLQSNTRLALSCGLTHGHGLVAQRAGQHLEARQAPSAAGFADRVRHRPLKSRFTPTKKPASRGLFNGFRWLSAARESP
jgi:16S rRNA (cytidine1402-2'-O)-methyltransferase